MSVTSTRNIQVQFSGDITLEVIQSALANNVSPGMMDIVTLTPGVNTILAPVISGIVITALTIIPPAGNINVITLRGLSSDAGIPLHITDPTTISLDPTFVSCVLWTGATYVIGVRLIWS